MYMENMENVGLFAVNKSSQNMQKYKQKVIFYCFDNEYLIIDATTANFFGNNTGPVH